MHFGGLMKGDRGYQNSLWTLWALRRLALVGAKRATTGESVRLDRRRFDNGGIML